MVIGDRSRIENVLSKIELNQSNKIVGYVSNEPINNDKELKYASLQGANIEAMVTALNVNEILICATINDYNAHDINTQLIILFEKGMSIRSLDSFLENETFKISERQLIANFYNYFSFSKNHQNNLYLAFRRLVDVIFAFIGIFFFIALVPVVFLFNLIGNKGKLIYIQNRVGKGGKEFKIIKFRSMVSNAEKNGAEWSKTGDVRITPFGRILRKTRLDEVPQFINVLKGDMSLIGPRPERPEFVT